MGVMCDDGRRGGEKMAALKFIFCMEETVIIILLHLLLHFSHEQVHVDGYSRKFVQILM